MTQTVDFGDGGHDGHHVTKVPYAHGEVVKQCGQPLPAGYIEFADYCIDCDEVLAE